MSHCVRRATAPDWPYALYAMVHGRDGEGQEACTGEIARLAGASEYVTLPTLREFKKERVRLRV